ncbi:unnamed protein product [Closterium sp. NIES-54]
MVMQGGCTPSPLPSQYPVHTPHSLPPPAPHPFSPTPFLSPQVLILGIFTGTVFFQIPNTISTATMQLRLSIAFAATMALALGGFALIPNIIDERQVVEKQLGARFYRSTSYVIASTICNFPFSLAEVSRGTGDAWSRGG